MKRLLNFLLHRENNASAAIAPEDRQSQEYDTATLLEAQLANSPLYGIELHLSLQRYYEK